MSRKRLLIDVDEVLADFHTPFLSVVERVLGRRMTMDEFPEWDLFKAFEPDDRKLVFDAMCEPHYCLNFPVAEGALEAVKALREIVEVTPVTRPFPSPTWVYDRTLWLKEHFGFEDIEIVNTGAKYLVWGDAFLDDHPENVVSWEEYHPEGVAMLWHSVTTRHQTEHDRLRVRTWDEVLRKVREL
jgi:5'(3')-deoxyribonucleotidase